MNSTVGVGTKFEFKIYIDISKKYDNGDKSENDINEKYGTERLVLNGVGDYQF